MEAKALSQNTLDDLKATPCLSQTHADTRETHFAALINNVVTNDIPQKSDCFFFPDVSAMFFSLQKAVV